MKVQNSHLSITLEAIKLTESEMEAITGGNIAAGKYTSDDFQNLWAKYKGALLAKDSATLNYVGGLCGTENNLKTTDLKAFQHDKDEFSKFYNDPKNLADQGSIKSIGQKFGFI
ncbi:MAG: hypothetical protein DSM106950_29710 [Stigonema ocellatum SAG 48.90 = DSM 106950]|nr:hypothetical protein [Stigonema ocellatum SAG 48.90 = DSM 106950]